MKHRHLNVVLTIMAVCCFALTATTLLADEEPSVTGNLTISSDYVFRGLSLTQGNMAVQGEFDYTAKNSGFYAGIWASNVSSELFNEGSSELDIYAGVTKESKNAAFDFGVIHYFYDGAKTGGTPSVDYDTTEIYLGISHKEFTLKYSRTLDDWFGVCSDNPFNLSGTPAGDSDGSSYIEFNVALQPEEDVALELHVGHQKVAGYGDADYTDYSVKVIKSLDECDLGLQWTNSNADETLYTVNGEDNGDSRVIFSISKEF